ncbi:hypothetical protein MRX96_007668 [Rhipicephalus microplus]
MGNRSSSEYEGGSWLRTLKNGTCTSTQDRKRLWDSQLTWDERLILWILDKGVVPRHVALVPDGNRRYAKLNELELHSAYDVMFEKTTLMCQYMVKLGVEDISYGILSIRNFYRDASEVNAVLSAMANFYRTALCNTNSLQRINLLVSTIGDMNMHPEELQSDMAQVEIVTANEGWTRKCRLFSAYTSRSELTKVIVHMANAVRIDFMRSEDITVELIQKMLALSETPETELWFRSTGRQCFVEFVVFQSGYSYMHIEPQLWPSVGFRRFTLFFVYYGGPATDKKTVIRDYKVAKWDVVVGNAPAMAVAYFLVKYHGHLFTVVHLMSTTAWLSPPTLHWWPLVCRCHSPCSS